MIQYFTMKKREIKTTHIYEKPCIVGYILFPESSYVEAFIYSTYEFYWHCKQGLWGDSYATMSLFALAFNQYCGCLYKSRLGFRHGC